MNQNLEQAILVSNKMSNSSIVSTMAADIDSQQQNHLEDAIVTLEELDLNWTMKDLANVIAYSVMSLGTHLNFPQSLVSTFLKPCEVL